jgi:hypothetical protein
LRQECAEDETGEESSDVAGFVDLRHSPRNDEIRDDPEQT